MAPRAADPKGAAAKRQAAAAKRQAQARARQMQALFDACTLLRFHVKLAHQGPQKKPLRRALGGEGIPAAASRPTSVARLAAHILKGAAAQPQALGPVRSGRSLLTRIKRLYEATGVAPAPRRGRR